MTNEFLHFEKISRQTWQNLHRKKNPPLTESELNSIKSFNDKISLQDVTDVYLPLTNLIQIYKRSKEDLAFSKGILPWIPDFLTCIITIFCSCPSLLIG